MSSRIDRLELTRKFEELRARLHSKHGSDSDGFSNIRSILDRFSEVHSTDPGTVHSTLRTLLSLYLNDMLPRDLLRRILVLDREPTFDDIEHAYSQGIAMIITVNGTVRAYCTYCHAELNSIAIEEATAEDAVIRNALYGKAMKESERQRKLQQVLEEARKRELAAKIKPPEVDYEPRQTIKRELQEHATRLLRRLIIKVLTIGRLKYVDDNVSENLLRDAAKRFVHLLCMRFKKFVEKGKGSKVMQFVSSERDILNIYERCIVEFKHGGHICKLIEQSTDFYGNRVFDEEVKQLLLQVLLRQLFLQSELPESLVKVWARCRKRFSLILTYLGADGQCRLPTLFSLIDNETILRNPELFLREEVFKLLCANRPELVKYLIAEHPYYTYILLRSLVS